MKNLISSLFLYYVTLFTLTLVQYLAGEKIFKKQNQQKIDLTYHISKDIYISNPLYYIREGTTGTKGVMMKVAKQDEKIIQAEIDVYKDIYIAPGSDDLMPFNIPNMFDYGVYDKKKVIITDLLGDDYLTLVRDVTDNNNPQYYGAVCQWAKQIIKALQFLHQHAYVHRDVRPENIAEGVADFEGHAYLYNLQLATPYTKHHDGCLKKQTKSRDLLDATPYLSRHSLSNMTQFPYDDIESLGYTMLRIAGSKELPWFNLSRADILHKMNIFFNNDHRVEPVCKEMGILDMGMINLFRNFFELLRVKYFTGAEDYKREIDYEDLSDCFVYPARALQYLGCLNQDTIDRIYKISKESANATVNEKYNIVRIGANQISNMQKGVTVKTAMRDDTLVRNGVKVFKDIYSTSGVKNLLPYNIANMLGYGVYEGKRAIVLDLLGFDLIEVSGNNGFNDPQYYGAVCFWATQMITALQFIHMQGYVHRDIQPKNIAAGAEGFNLNRTDVSFLGSVYLYNLGSARRYKYDNGAILQRIQHSALPYVASPYTSRAAMKAYTLYPRDDMEELGYTLLSITAGALPWSYFAFDEFGEKDLLFRDHQTVDIICKSMGISDTSMIIAFKSYFGLLHNRYFLDDDYTRVINYQELSACFAYPAY